MSHLTVGLISIALGLWGMASWWSVFGLVMRGIIPFALLLFGLIALLAACRRLTLVAPERHTGHAGHEGHSREGDTGQADPVEVNTADDILAV